MSKLRPTSKVVIRKTRWRSAIALVSTVAAVFAGIFAFANNVLSIKDAVNKAFSRKIGAHLTFSLQGANREVISVLVKNDGDEAGLMTGTAIMGMDVWFKDGSGFKDARFLKVSGEGASILVRPNEMRILNYVARNEQEVRTYRHSELSDFKCSLAIIVFEEGPNKPAQFPVGCITAVGWLWKMNWDDLKPGDF